MNILITGGAGYIGTVLVERLLAETDAKIVIFDNLMYKQDGIFALLHNPRVAFVYGDVRDRANLLPYLAWADYIIPLAAIVGMPACDKDPKLASDVNHHQLKFIAETTKVARIIVPNTNSGYGVMENGQPCTEDSPLKPLSVYGRTKCEGEKAVMDSGRGVALRLATLFGTSYRFRKDLLVNDFVLKALTDKYVVLFESHFKRNYIHIRDVVGVILRIIKMWDVYVGKVFNLGLSSANLNKMELCLKIKEHIPGFVIKQDEFTKDFDQRNYIVSNARLEATGWQPTFTLDDGIEELIKAYPVLIKTNTRYTNL